MSEKINSNTICKSNNIVYASNDLNGRVEKNEKEILDIQDNINTIINNVATIEIINDMNKEITNEIEDSHNKIVKMFIKTMVGLLLAQIFMFSYIISLI